VLLESYTVARPEAYTAAQMIEALEQTYGLVSPAARRIGCSPQTVYNYARRYTAVQDAIEEGRCCLLDLAGFSLFEAVEGCVMADGTIVPPQRWAIEFVLRTRGRDRGYTEPQRRRRTAKGRGAC